MSKMLLIINPVQPKGRQTQMKKYEIWLHGFKGILLM